MPPAEQLPEGTDTIIDSAGLASEDVNDASRSGGDRENKDRSVAPESGAAGGGDAGDVRSALFGRVEALKGQANDRARDFAQTGKDRATAALDDLVRMVEEAAGEIDAKLGAHYGDYARRAAEGIGGFSETVKNKDVDDLFAEAGALVRKSPGVAVGAAAAIGFVVARLVRAGIPNAAPQPDAATADAKPAA